jgi:SAM-dependent methyltransferase
LHHTRQGGKHLDAGCSTCGTVGHFVELRPDLKITAIDSCDFSAHVPPGVEFHQLDLVAEKFPFANESFDSITLMHVMEHLRDFGSMAPELCRILKPGGRLYVEGPGPRSLLFPRSSKTITLNFWDDPTHVAPLSFGAIQNLFAQAGLRAVAKGHSRSWILIAAIPYSAARADWHHLLAGLIHLFGWSIYVVFEKPQE